MAELIPALSICIGRMQAGERRFARRLASHLEDDYICWFDQPVGHRSRYTDFVVLHPGRGLLFLEVKDWKLDTIHKINNESAELLTSTGLKTVANPLTQARQCAYGLVNALEKDPQLVHAAGRHRGKLIMPYGFGVALTNITRSQFSSTDLGEVLPQTQTICKDEMLESVEVEDFQKRLWDMFNYRFSTVLTQPQVDRVRWHMFPEIRIRPNQQLELGHDEDTGDSFELPDLMKVMDLHQERVARGLGDGHRVIHGVAGSGKTMILGYRCLHLAKLLHKPILVLCYNVALAAHLRLLVREHQIEHRVNVYHFHDWCATILRTYNFPVPRRAGDDFEQSIERVIDKVGKGQIPSGQYGAILIDEGHDFKPHWLQLVVRMVDPDTKSLLLLYDDAQSIYENRAGLGFTLKDVGIEAQGRTTILKLNYRNTEEIIQFAYEFAKTYRESVKKPGKQVPDVTPASAGRHGPNPVLKQFRNFSEEARYIAGVYRKMHDERGVPWSSMCVVYCHRWMGKEIADEFQRTMIPTSWLRDTSAKKKLDVKEETVKLVTMHSSKGLEFETVAAAGVGYMGFEEEREASDAKLLYVAMTRAMDNLLVTSCKETPMVERLKQSLTLTGAKKIA